MNEVKAPRSLRFEAAINSVGQTIESNFRQDGFRGCGSDRRRVVFRRRSPAIQPPAGDGRCPGRSPASCRVKAFAGPGPRPHRAAPRRAARSRRRSPPCRFLNAGGLARRPQPLRESGGALRRSGAGIGQFPEPILNTPKIDHGADKDVLEGQEHRPRCAKSAVLTTAGVTLGLRRGRQRLRRPLLHPRFRCPQRRLHRRHP